METFDSIKFGDPVETTIIGPKGAHLFQSTVSDVKSAEEAVRKALDKAVLIVNPEDCVFEVKNVNTAQLREYRINAHGHLTRIV